MQTNLKLVVGVIVPILVSGVVGFSIGKN